MQTEKKKQYDRDYIARRYDDFRAKKDWVCLELLGGACFTCGATEGAANYHLHHIDYTDSDYPRNSKAFWTRVMRVDDAARNPEKFRLLCPSCHLLVTRWASVLLRANPETLDLERLYGLTLLEYQNRKNP